MAFDPSQDGPKHEPDPGAEISGALPALSPVEASIAAGNTRLDAILAAKCQGRSLLRKEDQPAISISIIIALSDLNRNLEGNRTAIAELCHAALTRAYAVDFLPTSGWHQIIKSFQLAIPAPDIVLDVVHAIGKNAQRQFAEPTAKTERDYINIMNSMVRCTDLLEACPAAPVPVQQMSDILVKLDTFAGRGEHRILTPVRFLIYKALLLGELDVAASMAEVAEAQITQGDDRDLDAQLPEVLGERAFTALLQGEKALALAKAEAACHPMPEDAKDVELAVIVLSALDKRGTVKTEAADDGSSQTVPELLNFAGIAAISCMYQSFQCGNDERAISIAENCASFLPAALEQNSKLRDQYAGVLLQLIRKHDLKQAITAKPSEHPLVFRIASLGATQPGGDTLSNFVYGSLLLLGSVREYPLQDLLMGGAAIPLDAQQLSMARAGIVAAEDALNSINPDSGAETHHGIKITTDAAMHASTVLRYAGAADLAQRAQDIFLRCYHWSSDLQLPISTNCKLGYLSDVMERSSFAEVIAVATELIEEQQGMDAECTIVRADARSYRAAARLMSGDIDNWYQDMAVAGGEWSTLNMNAASHRAGYYLFSSMNAKIEARAGMEEMGSPSEARTHLLAAARSLEGLLATPASHMPVLKDQRPSQMRKLISIYEQLGDQKNVERIQRRLDRLSEQNPA